MNISKQGKKRPQVVPQWMEVEHKLLDHLHSLKPQAQIALQLSDISGDYIGMANVVNSSEARKLHSEFGVWSGQGGHIVAKPLSRRKDYTNK